MGDFLRSISSKKFFVTIYTVTWLCVILLLYMFKTNNISSEMLVLIGTVFGAFVTGNVVGDHYGKAVTLTDKKEEQK